MSITSDLRRGMKPGIGSWEDDGGSGARSRPLGDPASVPIETHRDIGMRPAENSSEWDRELEKLMLHVDANERLLVVQFAAGRVSGTSFQHRSRVLRQQRQRLETAAPQRG